MSVCLCVLCSDDNDTKCSKLLRASLRGTSGLHDCCVNTVMPFAVVFTLIDHTNDDADGNNDVDDDNNSNSNTSKLWYFFFVIYNV